MNLKEVIMREIEGTSGSSLVETAIMSEFSLKKDWLMPEEDKTWQDL